MFSYIKVKNFKSLKDVEINFKENKNTVKPIAIIYGENGAGKSNICSAFYFLGESMSTMKTSKILENLLNKISEEEDVPDNIITYLKDRHRDTETIIKDCKTISSKENMVIEYGIEIDGDSGSYIIETNNERIVKEKLEFKIEQKRGYYFELLENEKIRLNNRIFKKQEYLNELKSNINRYWGKHSLLSIISNDMNNSIKGYVEKSISKNFLKILHMFNKMNCVVKEGTSLERGKLTTNKEMILNLQSGTIDLNKVKELDDTEEFLDNLLTNLYADIKNVYYKRSIVDDEINYELIIQKLIGNELLDINASMESTGTLSILKLLPAICMAISGSISIIDEFETGIHDVLVKDILKEINNNISGQIILTTHNTLILEQEEFKKYIYFIVVDSYGNKNVCSISDYDQRTQRNHNIRDLYLRGFYEGVPYIGNFDLSVVEDYFE